MIMCLKSVFFFLTGIGENEAFFAKCFYILYNNFRSNSMTYLKNNHVERSITFWKTFLLCTKAVAIV